MTKNRYRLYMLLIGALFTEILVLFGDIIGQWLIAAPIILGIFAIEVRRIYIKSNPEILNKDEASNEETI